MKQELTIDKEIRPIDAPVVQYAPSPELLFHVSMRKRSVLLAQEVTQLAADLRKVESARHDIERNATMALIAAERKLSQLSNDIRVFAGAVSDADKMIHHVCIWCHAAKTAERGACTNRQCVVYFANECLTLEPIAIASQQAAANADDAAAQEQAITCATSNQQPLETQET